MKKKSKKINLDETLQEAIRKAPPFCGYTLEELAETSHGIKSCPTCGRPYNYKVNY